MLKQFKPDNLIVSPRQASLAGKQARPEQATDEQRVDESLFAIQEIEEDWQWVELWGNDKTISAAEQLKRQSIIKKLRARLDQLTEAVNGVRTGKVSFASLGKNRRFVLARDLFLSDIKQTGLLKFIELKRSEREPETPDYEELLPSMNFDPAWYEAGEVLQANQTVLMAIEDAVGPDVRFEDAINKLKEFIFNPEIEQFAVRSLQEQTKDQTTAPLDLVWLESELSQIPTKSPAGRSDLWTDFCAMVQGNRQVLFAILGKAQAPVDPYDLSDRARENYEKEMLANMANIFNICLSNSANVLEQSGNERVRNRQKQVLTDFYGDLPKELDYEAEALEIQLMVNHVADKLAGQLKEQELEKFKQDLTVLLKFRAGESKLMAMDVDSLLAGVQSFLRPYLNDQRIEWDKERSVEWRDFRTHWWVKEFRDDEDKKNHEQLLKIYNKIQSAIERLMAAAQAKRFGRMVAAGFSARTSAEKMVQAEHANYAQAHALLKFVNQQHYYFRDIQKQLALAAVGGEFNLDNKWERRFYDKIRLLNFDYIKAVRSRLKNKAFMSAIAADPNQSESERLVSLPGYMRDFSEFSFLRADSDYRRDPVNFRKIDLRGVSFRQSVFSWRGADLSKADISQSDFSDCLFICVKFREITAAGANFAGSHFRGLNDFQKSQLAGANFDRVEVNNNTASSFDGPYLDFTGSDLTGASFHGAQLGLIALSSYSENKKIANRVTYFHDAVGAIFRDCHLAGVDFDLATLDRCVFSPDQLKKKELSAAIKKRLFNDIFHYIPSLIEGDLVYLSPEYGTMLDQSYQRELLDAESRLKELIANPVDYNERRRLTPDEFKQRVLEIKSEIKKYKSKIGRYL